MLRVTSTEMQNNWQVFTARPRAGYSDTRNGQVAAVLSGVGSVESIPFSSRKGFVW